MNSDFVAIRQSIDEWALARDCGDWDRLASIWLPEGGMVTTWCEVTAAEFVARSRRAWDDGVIVFHLMGGVTITIDGARAISEARVQIMQRATVHDVLVDVTCTGRMWDAWEKRDGRWGLMLRQPIYEIDRMAPVDPAATLMLDRDLLASFPAGYRHLAYLQSQLGLTITKGLPGTKGPEIEALKARGRQFLLGRPAECLFPNRRAA